MRHIRSLGAMPLKRTESPKNGHRNTQMQFEHLPCEPFQMLVKAKHKNAVKLNATSKLNKNGSKLKYSCHSVAKVNLDDVFYQEWSFDDVFLFGRADVPNPMSVSQVIMGVRKEQKEEKGAIDEEAKKKVDGGERDGEGENEGRGEKE